MKNRKKTLDIFNLSFLDIISCGFGAVIMLVMLSKSTDGIPIADKQQISSMLKTIVNLEYSITELKQIIDTLSAESSVSVTESQQLAQTEAQIKRAVAQQTAKKTTLSDTVQSLQLAQATLKNATASITEGDNTERDIEVGGIPVDSDYVIFIVDTSGSMQQIWSRVSQQIINVLNIHPQVKGFQVLNDMGKTIVSGYDGKWIPDTPKRRTSIIKLFNNWTDLSNSSPVEGLEIALRKYTKPNIKTSIYVFGDDYSGASYDPVIAKISRLNTSVLSGKKLAKIHGIGFISPNTTDRFGILMRELSKENGGTFLALPL